MTSLCGKCLAFYLYLSGWVIHQTHEAIPPHTRRKIVSSKVWERQCGIPKICQHVFMASSKVEILPKDELARGFQRWDEKCCDIVKTRLPASDGRKLTELTFYLLTQFLMFARCWRWFFIERHIIEYEVETIDYLLLLLCYCHLGLYSLVFFVIFLCLWSFVIINLAIDFIPMLIQYNAT